MTAAAQSLRAKPPGRRPLPPGLKLQPVMVRLTTHERALVKALAASIGISESAAIRRVIGETLVRVEAAGGNPARLREILSLVASAEPRRPGSKEDR